MKSHTFDVDIAVKYGIIEATLLSHIKFWIEKNIANNKNYYDDNYWTYNSIKAFKELFPYLSEKQIRYALKKLEQMQVIKTSNYNKSKYDRTNWYAIIDKSILQYGKIHLTKSTNGNDTEGEPIPDINTDIKPNIKKYKKEIITSNEVNQIIEFYNDMFQTKYRATPDRSKKIKLRLKTYNLDEIKTSIKNMKASKFHNGDNDRGWKATIDFIIRNDEKIDEFLNSEIKDRPHFISYTK
jgi:hypothetical protein